MARCPLYVVTVRQFHKGYIEGQKAFDMSNLDHQRVSRLYDFPAVSTYWSSVKEVEEPM